MRNVWGRGVSSSRPDDGLFSNSPPLQIQYVTHLDERLHGAPPLNLLLTHTARHFARVAFDAGNDSMGVGALLGSIVELLDDDDLAAGLTALEDDSNLERQRFVRSE